MAQFNGEALRRPSLVVSVIYYKTTVKKIIDDIGPIQLHCPEQYRRRLDDLRGWRKGKLLKDLCETCRSPEVELYTSRTIVVEDGVGENVSVLAITLYFK